jgi:hypothetical protein
MIKSIEARRLIVLLLIIGLPVMAEAEKFKYAFAKNDTLTYTINANSHVDLSKVATIATVLQITNLSQNTYLGADLTVESLGKDGEAAIKSLFRQVSLVMIKNDSIQTSNGSNWGGLKQGTIHNFRINPAGEIQSAATRPGTFDSQMITFWQMVLPAIPARSLDKGESWIDSVSFPLEISGMVPARVVCKMNYTYAGRDATPGKGHDRFDYTIEGSSAQNRNLHILGKGYFQFDKSAGRLLTNNCDFEMQGMIDLAQLGLPAELNASLPLAVKTQAIIKLQNEK